MVRATGESVPVLDETRKASGLDSGGTSSGAGRKSAVAAGKRGSGAGNPGKTTARTRGETRKLTGPWGASFDGKGTPEHS